MSYGLFKGRFYPLKRSCDREFKYEAIIGLGSNDVKKALIFKKLIRYWMDSRVLCVVQTGAIFKNPPFGYVEQDDFYNSVVKVKTSLGAKELLRYLLQTERYFRRVRVFKNGPRTLDLDLLFFDGLELKSRDLTDRKSVV